MKGGKRFLLIPLLISFLLYFNSFALTFNSFDDKYYEDLEIFNKDTRYEGDLVIGGNRSIVVENCNFEIRGRILILNDSRLILRNAKIKLVEPVSSQSRERASWFSLSGKAELQAKNISIETVFLQGFGIRVSENSRAYFDEVYSLDWYSLTCEDDSTVIVNNSVCWSMIEARNKSNIIIKNSKIYGLSIKENSSAILEGVYVTRICVADNGNFNIMNSTIDSEKPGLSLIFDKGTKLTLNSLNSIRSGLDYVYCEEWDIYKYNDVQSVYINIKIQKSYFKGINFVIKEGSEVNIFGLNSSVVNVEANSKNIEIVGSVLNEVKILNGCFLLASHIGINKLETLDNSSAYIENSRIKKVLCKNSSNLILYSSIIDSMECNGDSFIHMKGSEVSKYISVSNNSITFFTPKYINIEKINYNVLNGDLIMSLVNLLRNHTKVSILINRDRIGDRNSLKIMCDGENISYKFEDRKDMEILTFEMTSNMMNLEVSLGPPPTKPTNFFLTSVGQQLISLMIIIVLSGAVILLWR